MEGSDYVKISAVYDAGKFKTDLLVKLKNDIVRDYSKFNLSVLSDQKDSSKVTLLAKMNNSVFAGTSDASTSMNHILIVNRKKKRAKLLPISVCNLTELRDDEESSISDIGESGVRDNLTDRFGSKRSKRRMELNYRMTVNPEACGELLKPVLDETVIDPSYFEEFNNDSESLERLLPPYNRFAPDIREVYKVDDLLNKKERSSLKDIAKFLLENPPNETSSSKFLCTYYKRITQDITVDKVVLLLYVDCLLRLLNMRQSDWKNKDAWDGLSPHSRLVLMKIKIEFSDNRMVTTSLRFKAACHALVALLLACNYVLDFDTVVQYFCGFHLNTLRQLCSLVGLTSRSRGSSDLVLKVPLPPIPVNRSPNKKRKLRNV